MARGWQRVWDPGRLSIRARRAVVGILLGVMGFSLAFAGSSLIAQSKEVNLTLVSFAVTRAAYQRIIPKFVEKWKQETGQTVRFRESYGASGSQTRAVLDGLEADVVALALALDTQRIEKAGLINPGWDKELPNNAIVTRSVAALVVRDGNPKGIRTWADLAKPGVEVITANPKTSGGARWNVLGIWGSVTRTGGDEARARDLLNRVFANALILPRDAREATDIFLKKGQGDVLINYENEVLLAELESGQKLTYVIPDVNISIDNPIAIVDKNVDKHGNRKVAEEFVKYLFTTESQRIFASVGFRPIDNKELRDYQTRLKKFPEVKTLFTVQDLGGWEAIQKKFFDDGAIFDQIQASPRT